MQVELHTTRWMVPEALLEGSSGAKAACPKSTRATGSWLFIVCIGLGASVACGQAARGRDNDRMVLDRLARTSGCRPLGFSIGHGPGVSLSKKDQCTLASAAFDYLAANGAQAAGLSAQDTAKIESASIHSFAFDDISGGPGESYWTVEFQIVDRSYDIVVRIDRGDGSVSAGRGHF